METNINSEIFDGIVKYQSATLYGSVKWKSGSIIIDKDGEHGWHIRMKFKYSDHFVISLPLNKDTLKKYVCKDIVFIDVKKGVHLVSLYLKPNDKSAVKHIEQLCQEVLRTKVNVEKCNETIACEVPVPSIGVMKANEVHKKEMNSERAAKRKVQSPSSIQERLLEIEEKKLKIEEKKLKLEKEKVDILRTMSENISKICNSKLLNCSGKISTKCKVSFIQE